jgi:hypothetical protein
VREKKRQKAYSTVHRVAWRALYRTQCYQSKGYSTAASKPRQGHDAVTLHIFVPCAAACVRAQLPCHANPASGVLDRWHRVPSFQGRARNIASTNSDVHSNDATYSLHWLAVGATLFHLVCPFFSFFLNWITSFVTHGRMHAMAFVLILSDP